MFFNVELFAGQNNTMYLQKGAQKIKYSITEIDSVKSITNEIWAFDSIRIFRNNTGNETHNVNDITSITFSELDTSNVTKKIFYVATDGKDIAGGGTITAPWATVNYAVRNVPKDALCTIIVRDGIYDGFTLQGSTYHFEYPCLIQSENPYKAKFKGRSRVFSIYNASNITFSGFDIYGEGMDIDPVAGNEYVIHISNNSTYNITFEDCIIHDSYNNDMIKINVHPENIIFSNCIFYNQCPRGGDQFFDIIGAFNVMIEKCIFFNHYESSERGGTFPSNNNIPSNEFLTRSQGFILVKNMSERNRGADITIRKNIFFNWTGKPDACFIILGEGVGDETSFVHYQAENIHIENNLFLYNPYDDTYIGRRGMLLAQSVRNLKVRANTVLGTRPGGLYSTRGFMVYTHRSAIAKGELPSTGWEFTNNIFCDNQAWTGDNRPILSFVSSSNPPFEDDGTGKSVPGSYSLLNNLYWAGGVTGTWIVDPSTGGDRTKLIVSEDNQRIETNPQLPADFDNLVLPVLASQGDTFISGNSTIREEFVRLALKYAVPQPGGAGIGNGDAGYMPEDDILDNPRGKTPSVGCYEMP